MNYAALVDPWRDELVAHYTGPDGEITIDRNPTKWSEGQGIAWTSLKLIIACLLNERSAQDLDQFHAFLRACEVGKPGRYNRKAGDPHVINAHDDLAYAAVASMLGDPERRVAKAILAAFREAEGSINNVTPEAESPRTWPHLVQWSRYWLGRHIWFLPLLKVCAGEPIDWYERGMLGAGLIAPTIKGTNESGQLMAFLRSIAAYKAGGNFLRLVRWAWIKTLRSRYPGGMWGVCVGYFNHRSPNNPFSWKAIWEALSKEGWS